MPQGRIPRNPGSSGWDLNRTLKVLIQGYPKEAERLRLSVEKIPTMTYGEKQNARADLRAYAATHWGYLAKPTTTKAIFAEYLYQTGGISKYHVTMAYIKISPLLNLAGEIDGPFVMMRNPKERGGNRIPMERLSEHTPGGEIETKARAHFSAVKGDVARRISRDSGIPQPTPEPESKAPEPTPEPKRVPEPKNPFIEYERAGIKRADWTELSEEQEDVFRKIANAHLFMEDRVIADQIPPDRIGMRPFVDGAKLLKLGVSGQIVISNMIQHWSVENKRTIWNMAGLYQTQHRKETNPWDYDPCEFVPRPDIPGVEFIDPDKHHRALGLMLTFAHARTPILTWGPSGSGKTTSYRHMAECLRKFLGATEEEFPFGFISMTRGTSPSAFNGRPIISNTSMLIEYQHAQANGDEARMTAIAKKAQEQGDVVMSMWQKIYTKGGVMLLDEIDAGDENLILLVNAAISNGHFANTATGEVVERHPDFIIGFAGNTNGTGANRLHGARNRLDHATLDRVREGRIEFNLDLHLARKEYEAILTA